MFLIFINFVWIILPVSAIIGGEESILGGDWTSVCSLQLLDNTHLCGVTLIRQSWALTSSQCVLDNPPWEMQIYCGSKTLDSNDANGMVLAIDDVIINDFFEYIPAQFPNDLALLKLKEPVNISKSVTLSNLATISNIRYLHDDCHIVGWGLTNKCYDTSNKCESKNCKNGDAGCRKTCSSCNATLNMVPSVMNEAVARLVDMSYCLQTLKISNGKICSLEEEEGYRGPCQGDIGGPLFCKVQDAIYQIGSISWFPTSCTSKSSVVYTRLDSYSKWISNVTGENLFTKTIEL